jgi:lincosamide nucleotidyltransferase A/C/D/E
VSEEDVLEVLTRLDAAGIAWWIDGGWGVDALLGRQLRHHDDLDLAIPREDIDSLQTVFPEYDRVDEHEWPNYYALRHGPERRLDFIPLEFDDSGDAFHTSAGGARELWSRETLGARGEIGGRRVRCTSPAFQIASHLYDGHDAVDWDDAMRLSERFGIPLPEGLERPAFVHERRSQR